MQNEGVNLSKTHLYFSDLLFSANDDDHNNYRDNNNQQQQQCSSSTDNDSSIHSCIYKYLGHQLFSNIKADNIDS